MNLSFSLTRDALLAGRKTVTRRAGWLRLVKHFADPDAKPLPMQAIFKGMGLKRGEHPEVLCQILVTSARREPLRRMVDEPDYGRAEVIAEGFPDLTPAEFVAFFMRTHKGLTPESAVTRIKFAEFAISLILMGSGGPASPSPSRPPATGQGCSPPSRPGRRSNAAGTNRPASTAPPHPWAASPSGA